MKKRMAASFLLMLLRDFFSPLRRQMPENSSAWLKTEISVGMDAWLGTSSRLTIVGNLSFAHSQIQSGSPKSIRKFDKKQILPDVHLCHERPRLKRAH